MSTDFEELWKQLCNGEQPTCPDWDIPVKKPQPVPLSTNPTFIDLDKDLDEWLASQPTSTQSKPLKPVRPTTPPAPAKRAVTSHKAKTDKAFAIKAFATFTAVIILIGSLCLTAFMNHKVNEANQAASEILSSAEAECKNIRDIADEEASKKIAEAEAKAKNIKEETE